MKKIFLFIAVASLSISSGSVVAQKSFTEGKIVYEISYPDMEMDPNMAAMMPTEQVVYVKGQMSRSELSMGMGINSSSIMNGKTGELISLTDMMGNKSAIRMSPDEMDKAMEKSNDGKSKVTLTTETREIAGYSCKKAVISNDTGAIMDIYYTDKISSKLAGMSFQKEIKGFPLEYSVEQSGIKMKFSAKSVASEKVADDKFVIPSDYKIMTQEEMMKQFGGGQ